MGCLSPESPHLPCGDDDCGAGDLQKGGGEVSEGVMRDLVITRGHLPKDLRVQNPAKRGFKAQIVPSTASRDCAEFEGEPWEVVRGCSLTFFPSVIKHMLEQFYEPLYKVVGFPHCSYTAEAHLRAFSVWRFLEVHDLLPL